MAPKFFTSDSSIARVRARIPAGAWDAHMHVVDLEQYPPSGPLTYTPASHSLAQAKEFLGSVGIERMVVVQPSFYGTDNRCTLGAVAGLGLSHGRAVIQFDPKTVTKEELQSFHDQGARGVRLNIRSVGGEVTYDATLKEMSAYADLVRPFGWILQLYVNMKQIDVLAQIIPQLNIRVCIDHIGHPDLSPSITSATELAGFPALLRLIEQGSTWVKLSGTYRISDDPENKLVKDLIAQILKVRTDRSVVATDWPHTRFDDLSVGPYFETIIDAVEKAGATLESQFVTNVEVLFDAKSS